MASILSDCQQVPMGCLYAKWISVKLPWYISQKRWNCHQRALRQCLSPLLIVLILNTMRHIEWSTKRTWKRYHHTGKYGIHFHLHITLYHFDGSRIRHDCTENGHIRNHNSRGVHMYSIIQCTATRWPRQSYPGTRDILAMINDIPRSILTMIKYRAPVTQRCRSVDQRIAQCQQSFTDIYALYHNSGSMQNLIERHYSVQSFIA